MFPDFSKQNRSFGVKENMRNHLASLFCFLLITTSGFGQEASQPSIEPSSRRVELLKRFPESDSNGDGVLSVRELAAHMAKQRSSPETKARLNAQLKRFPNADANGDGVLSGDEWRKFLVSKQGNRQGRSRRSNSAEIPEPDYSNVRYGDHKRCVMDIWLAKSDEKTPVVISVHGGGFSGGDKALASRSVEEYRSKGITFVSINYPFKTQVPWSEVFPQAVRSIQFLRYHSERYNIDNNRVAMTGGSAGGGITLWALFHDDLADPYSDDPVTRESSKPQCGVALSTQATYDQMIWHKILGVEESAITALKSREDFADWLGIKVNELTSSKGIELRRSIDMLQMIDELDPPLMLVNPRPNELPGDIVHHPIHSIAVKEKCDAAGVECKIVLAVTPPSERSRNVDFILQKLKKNSSSE